MVGNSSYDVLCLYLRIFAHFFTKVVTPSLEQRVVLVLSSNTTSIYYTIMDFSGVKHDVIFTEKIIIDRGNNYFLVDINIMYNT